MAAVIDLIISSEEPPKEGSVTFRRETKDFVSVKNATMTLTLDLEQGLHQIVVRHKNKDIVLCQLVESTGATVTLTEEIERVIVFDQQEAYTVWTGGKMIGVRPLKWQKK